MRSWIFISRLIMGPSALRVVHSGDQCNVTYKGRVPSRPYHKSVMYNSKTAEVTCLRARCINGWILLMPMVVFSKCTQNQKEILQSGSALSISSRSPSISPQNSSASTRRACNPLKLSTWPVQNTSKRTRQRALVYTERWTCECTILESIKVQSKVHSTREISMGSYRSRLFDSKRCCEAVCSAQTQKCRHRLWCASRAHRRARSRSQRQRQCHPVPATQERHVQ